MQEFDSKYRQILVAARRARQLQNGAKSMIESKSGKACKIALEEIKAGKVEYVAISSPKTNTSH
jgi:DNA-directed RNA polymerase subunit omega